MTNAQRLRYDAAHLCALQASGRGAETIQQIADALGMTSSLPPQLAIAAISASVGAGTWREVRAEAEAKLRGERWPSPPIAPRRRACR